MPLRATGIVVRHHPSLPPALDGVSIDVGPGEVVVVVGPNGSGKSTLGRALAGLLELESGAIDGGGPGAPPPRIGLVLQDPATQLVAATVADELALGPEATGGRHDVVLATVSQLLEAHGMLDVAARDPRELSGGQQQRVAVAALEACEVDVLILDEPTALLDGPSRQRCRRLVRELAGTRGVCWISQEPDEIGWGDRVVVLDAGRVGWSGTASEFVSDPRIAATFGLELPAAARMAHELVRAGAWPAHAAIPVRHEQLVAAILAPGGRAHG